MSVTITRVLEWCLFVERARAIRPDIISYAYTGGRGCHVTDVRFCGSWLTTVKKCSGPEAPGTNRFAVPNSVGRMVGPI